MKRKDDTPLDTPLGQIHAPPEEIEATGKHVENHDKRIWREKDGWCSACYREGLVVVHYGVEDRNFALCATCISRMREALFAPSIITRGESDNGR